MNAYRSARGRRCLCRCLAGIALVASTATVNSVPALSAAPIEPLTSDPSCAPDGASTSICGVTKPEDMVLFAGTQFVIVSGYAPDALYRVNSRTHEVQNLVPATSIAWDRKTYPNCPGPLARGGLIAHGIGIGDGPSPTFYVINHGGREAVEIYKLRKSDAALTWNGCVLIPDKLMANSIAPLRSGGFVMTNLAIPSPTVLHDLIAGRITGDVRLWSRGRGWRILPNSQGSGPNGLVISPDDRFIYVAMSGSRNIVRMSLQGATAPVPSRQIDIMPDNLRWTSDGTILVTGMRFDPTSNLKCFKDPTCRPPFDVFEIAPSTLNVRSLSDQYTARPVSLPTTALKVGSALWVSSIMGQSVAIFPLTKLPVGRTVP